MIIDHVRRIAAIFAILATPIGCGGVSTSDEVSMGEEYDTLIKDTVPIISDVEIENYLGSIGRRIAEPQDERQLDWHFQLINVSEPNAFAIPGGFVYVTRGLVERMDSMDELAGILGHEISHVIRRHSVERMIKTDRAQKAVFAFCLITGKCDLRTMVGIEVGGELLSAQYSQEDEREADRNAIAYVVRVGIHPGGIPRMFTKLLAERERQPSLVDAWFGTHPTEEERVARAERAISDIDPDVLARLRVDEPAFQAFRARISALPPAKSLQEIDATGAQQNSKGLRPVGRF
jgi:predicted Zn-dependent protease